MPKMNLKIVTPERIVLDDEVDMVIVRTIDGDRGILPRHAPLLTSLEIGEIRVKDDGKEQSIASSQGYMEVNSSEVTILVNTAELEDEIDVERALDAKQRAQKRLEKKSSEARINEKRAEIALRKALNRVNVAKKNKHD